MRGPRAGVRQPAALQQRRGFGGKDSGRGVVRQSSLTSVAATVAVASGLLLDMTIAGSFGISKESDAFVVASRLPLGLLAMYIATANQALVPTISAWLVRHSRARTSQLVTALLVVVVAGAAALAVVMALLADPLVRVLAPGRGQEAWDLAASLTRIMVLVVPLTAGCEVLRAYLNARLSFVLPAAMTVTLNTVAALIILFGGDNIHIVPIAYVVGLSVQFAVMLATAWRKGLRLQPASLRSPEVARTLRLCGRPLAASSLNPVARVVELMFASFLPTGSQSILNYGNRLVSAIGGTVLFRSVIVAIVPRLSRAEAERRHADVARLTVVGTRVMLSLSFALTAFMLALSEPGIRLLYHRGAFSADSATLLGWTLVVYAGSLVGSALQRAFLAPFYARMDTRTPLRNTVYGVGANILMIGPLLLVFGRGRDGVMAMAVAYSLSQYVHVAHIWYRLRQEFDIPLAPLRGQLVRSAAGAAAATGVMAVVADLASLYDRVSRAHLAGGLVIAALAGFAVVAVTETVGGSNPITTLRGVKAGAPPVPAATRPGSAAAGPSTRAPLTATSGDGGRRASADDGVAHANPAREVPEAAGRAGGRRATAAGTPRARHARKRWDPLAGRRSTWGG